MDAINEKIFEINHRDLNRCVYSDMVVYARVYKVYDGDTISIIFEYKGDFIKYSCRVNRIDTPEMRSKILLEKEKAYEAQKYLSDMVLEKIILVKILDFDKYGRLIVEIYNPNNLENINDMMITGGFANEYYGGKKLPFTFN